MVASLLASYAMNGSADTVVGTAATDIGHGFVDVGIGWFANLNQQGCSRHDLTTLAIATLGDCFVNPCLLQWMEAVFGEVFYGRD